MKLLLAVLVLALAVTPVAWAGANSGGIGTPSYPGTENGRPWRGGQASFYGRGSFTGYCGQRFVSEKTLVVAHKSFRCGQKIQFQRRGSQKVFVARVVDRGPFAAGRHFDLSWLLAKKLGLISQGVGPVKYRLVK